MRFANVMDLSVVDESVIVAHSKLEEIEMVCAKVAQRPKRMRFSVSGSTHRVLLVDGSG